MEKNLENWEVYFIESICFNLMKKHQYDLTNFDRNKIKKFKQKINSVLKRNNTLNENYKNFLKKNIGTNKYPTDPTDPRNWGSQEDDSKWFIETDLSKKILSRIGLNIKNR